MEADGATSREGAAESRRMRSDGGRRAARLEVHIVSMYHSHVTKFSPHRQTLLMSTEHVAFDVLYIK